jgi:hypothetical protein
MLNTLKSSLADILTLTTTDGASENVCTVIGYFILQIVIMCHKIFCLCIFIFIECLLFCTNVYLLYIILEPELLIVFLHHKLEL